MVIEICVNTPRSPLELGGLICNKRIRLKISEVLYVRSGEGSNETRIDGLGKRKYIGQPA